jgi:hypothetical protein
MFWSNFDHPQGDIFFFTSVTKGKIIWFVVACLLHLLCFALPNLVVAVQQQPVFVGYTLAFALQLSKKHGKKPQGRKTSAKVEKLQ